MQAVNQQQLDLGLDAADVCKIIEASSSPLHIDRLQRLKDALNHPQSRYTGIPESERADLARQILGRITALRGVFKQQDKHEDKQRVVRVPAAQIDRVQIDLDLFGTADRLPRRPYCTDDLAEGLRIRSLEQALSKPYLQINPPHLRVWAVFDLDRPDAATAWEDAMLPPPAWAAINRENGHAHLVWGLSAPVLVDSPDMRQAPLRYLCAVEAAFREKLEADSGYSGLITKNPQHPLWRVLKGKRQGYELAELAECVDLKKHSPKRKPEEIGLGRNVILFDWLRQYAYRHIRRAKAESKLSAWQAHLSEKALQRNGEFRVPLHPSEVGHIVKSVAKWTWHRFDLADSDAKFSRLQAHRGRRAGNQAEIAAAGGLASGLARLARQEDRRTTAILMRAKGMSTRQIAAELGVAQSTAVRWLAK